MLDHNSNSDTSLAWLDHQSSSRFLKIHAQARAADPTQLCFFAPDFSLTNPTPWFTGEEISRVSLEPDQPKLSGRSGTVFTSFSHMHEDVMKRIHAGEFRKLVPIIVENLEFKHPLHLSMFARLLQASPETQYSYGYEFQGSGLVGLTPELLFAVRGGRLQTMALAGTGRADGPSLFDSAKEVREHALVIEDIRHEMKAFGTVNVGRTLEKKFGILKHLFTPIDVKLEHTPDFMKIVTALHPTAALGGWPRKPAIKWLSEQGFSEQRKHFGAPYGWQKDGEMLCVVAIRCLQWEAEKARVFTGCGVVEESRAESEWQELVLKRNAVYKQLDLEF